MKIILTVLFCLCVPLMAADKKALTKEQSAKVIEYAIHGAVGKSTLSELTKADFERVTRLDFYNEQLTDVKGLEKLTQFRELTLTSNQLTDVKGLEKLTQLRLLVLSDNQLTDVKGLEKLTQLKVLRLSGNQITDVKGLEKLTQLVWLEIYNNPDLTKAQIDELKKALPNCDIGSNTKK